jgi:hypothetical protein
VVIFIATHDGYKDMQPLLAHCAAWVADGVLSEIELRDLRQCGVNISNFTRPTGLDDALRIIAEHHPGERIWVENQPPQLPD